MPFRNVDRQTFTISTEITDLAYISLIAEGNDLLPFTVVCYHLTNYCKYADRSVESRMPAIGICKDGALVNTLAKITLKGIIENPAWSLSPDMFIFVSTLGQITQVVPTTGYVQNIGYAMSTTKIYLEVSIPIKRA